MSWRIGVALLPLVLALPASAGAGDEGAKLGEAERAVAELAKGYSAAREAMLERLEAMREGEEFKKAREAEDYERIKALSEEISKPVQEEWRRKFEEGAAKYDGTEGEVVFAAAILKHWLVAEPAAIILDTLAEHAASPRLGPVLDAAPRLAKGDRKEELRTCLGRVIAENPDAAVRAHAHFARAEATRYDPESTEEEKIQAEADRAAVLELVPESSILSMRVRGPDFEKTRLQVGMTAPEIEGPNLFGKNIRLSDFRGKVVMLDFWGDW